YNDNNATTPEATLAALKSFNAPIILIAGGADKGLDLSVFLEEIKKCKKVLWLDGSGTKKVNPSSDLIYQVMSEAVADAFKLATPGDILLFSPAFASFGLFKNEYDRNDQFLAQVKAL
ncbi:UDP-N-acetylmuramoyl-L-alanine--D-glutamate ligase, partial [Candidatus Parcubacteria bacterium]|nr:UDP-N-acetylmuramoyl-L-alanine--D-glutamate ligase [Candidatus Parcubacteria bacterium]